MLFVPTASCRFANDRPGACCCNCRTRSSIAVKLVSVLTARLLNSSTRSRLVGGLISHNAQATMKTTKAHFQKLLRFMKRELRLARGSFSDFRNGALEHLQFRVCRADGDGFF